MPRTRHWIVDVADYLDETGQPVAEMPAEAFAVASFMLAIVQWVSLVDTVGHAVLTNVSCVRRPGRRHCRGSILARLEESEGPITWACSSCGEHGIISGWQRTLFDRRGELARPTGGWNVH